MQQLQITLTAKPENEAHLQTIIDAVKASREYFEECQIKKHEIQCVLVKSPLAKPQYIQVTKK